MTISPEIAARIQDMIATGRYGSPDDVLANAIDALQERDTHTQSELPEGLAEQLLHGIRSGIGVVVNEGDWARFAAELRAKHERSHR